MPYDLQVPKGFLTALLVVAAAVLTALGPNLPFLADHLLGAADSDASNHLWGWAWVQRTLLESGRVPLELNAANYPDGGAFFCLDTANALLFLPLAVLTPTLAHNLISLTHLVLAGLSAWCLAREWVDPEPALFAALAFALSPYVLTHGVASGVAEGLFLFPVPLVILFGVRVWTRPGWGAALALGAVTVLQAFGSWHYGLVAGLLLLLGAAVHWRRPAPGVLPRLGVATAVALMGLMPLAWMIGGSVDQGAAYERGLSLFPQMSALELPPVNILGLVDGLVPTDAALRAFEEGPDRMVSSGYLGLVVLGLAAWGRSWRLGALALVFYAFAMGPRVHLWTLDGSGVANPLYLLFYTVVPLFHETRHVTARFVVGASLALGLAAALGAARLPVWPRRIALGVLVVDLLFLAPTPWPQPQTPTAAHPVNERIEGPVLELPWLTPGGQFEDDILVQAVWHTQPIPFNLQGGGDQLLSPSLRQNPFVNGLRHQMEDGRPGHCGGVDELRSIGLKHVVLRRDEGGVQDTLERCLGPGEEVDGRILFSL